MEHVDQRIIKITGTSTEIFAISLRQDDNGKWKILNARRYWFSCWSTPSICGIGPTPTPSGTKGVVTLGTPENQKAYKDFGELSTMPTFHKNQLDEFLGKSLSDPFYVCPNVWINPKSGLNYPDFTFYFDASQDDEGKGFLVAVFPPSSEEEPYISAETSYIPSGFNGKFFITAGYQPNFKQPIPGEYKIQLHFTGCEIYTETITWCLNMSNGCTSEETNISTPSSTPTSLPVSSSPVLTSVEETKNFISKKGGYMQALWESGLSSYATTFPSQNPPYQPGDILIFNVSLSENTPVLWVHEECAPSMNDLDNTFSSLTIEFILDNEAISLNDFALMESKFFDGSPCREYVALINHWTSGEHILETHATYSKTIQNTGGSQLPGTYIEKYIVKVHP
ncbi:MAG: hypothetical protein DWB57_18330 [Candidatus Brocadia sp.]|nr:hypothetical protein [Candidatus Brocadia sp.]